MSGHAQDRPDDLSNLPKAPPVSERELPDPDLGADESRLAHFVLTVAEVLSVLSCLTTVGMVLYLVIYQIDLYNPFLVLAVGFLSLCYNAALLVVFRRVKHWK